MTAPTPDLVAAAVEALSVLSRLTPGHCPHLLG